jgi:hypothetical protein
MDVVASLEFQELPEMVTNLPYSITIDMRFTIEIVIQVCMAVDETHDLLAVGSQRGVCILDIR